MSLEEGCRVIYVPDGSVGTVRKVHNHIIFKCATVEFDRGPQAGTTSDCKGGNLSVQGVSPSQITPIGSALAAPGVILHGIATAAEVGVHAPFNICNQQPLSTMTMEARTCAVVADACYKYPAGDRDQVRPARIESSHQQHWTLDLDPDMNEDLFVVYVVAEGEHAGCPVLAFMGTRFGMPEFHEDIVPDGDIAVCGSFRMATEERGRWIFSSIRAVSNKYPGKRRFLTGHSLGGTRALIAALGGDGTQEYMLVHELVDEFHIFNPGSGLSPHGFNLAGGRLRACGFIHRILYDMVSITNFPCHLGGKHTLVVYTKHPDAEGYHSMANFCLPPPED